MTTINLDAYRTPALTITLAGETYTSQPPDTETMLLFAALIGAGELAAVSNPDKCPTCGKPTEELPDEWRDLIEKHATRDLAEIVYGPDAERMTHNGLPDADKTMAALYGVFYWLYGQDAAAEFVKTTRQGPSAPKDPQRSKNGPHTASGNPTRTASTRPTRSRKN